EPARPMRGHFAGASRPHNPDAVVRSRGSRPRIRPLHGGRTSRIQTVTARLTVDGHTNPDPRPRTPAPVCVPRLREPRNVKTNLGLLYYQRAGCRRPDSSATRRPAPRRTRSTSAAAGRTPRSGGSPPRRGARTRGRAVLRRRGG